MDKNDVLKAFDQLSTEDQQAVREALSERAAATSCCSPGEMEKHMASMMNMMHGSENPGDQCNQMMAMCRQMMEKMRSANAPAPNDA